MSKQVHNFLECKTFAEGDLGKLESKLMDTNKESSLFLHNIGRYTHLRPTKLEFEAEGTLQYRIGESKDELGVVLGKKSIAFL